MFGIATLSGSAQATATVGLVLAEAIVLYVSYGVLSQFASSTVLDALGADQ